MTTTETRTAVVLLETKWRPIAKNPPPRGLKIQLINRSDGVAVYGVWQPGSHWTHWHPLPAWGDK